MKLLWIGIGDVDPRYPRHVALTSELKTRGIRHEFHETPGSHEWKVWRVELEGFLQKIFK